MKLLDLTQKNEDGSLSPKLDKGQRILLVGRSGSGKSNAEISFPKTSYTFDCDNRFKGAVSAIQWLPQEELSQIEFDFYNPKDGFEAIDKKLNEIANAVENRTSKIKTLNFDSIGSLVYLLTLDSQRKRGVSNDGGFKGKIRGKVQFIHPDDYNYTYTAMRLLMFNYIMPLNEMGVNTLFSAWVVDKWGKKPGSPEYAPAEVTGEKIVGPGNLVEEVAGYFDELYYFRRKSTLSGLEPKFTVEWNGAFAKTALGLPPGEIDVTKKNFYEVWINSVPSYKSSASPVVVTPQ